MAQPNHTPGAESAGYEKKDVNIKLVLLVAAIIIITIIVFIFWIDSLYQITRDETIQSNQLAPTSTALTELRTHEDEVLNSYKLLDPATGKYQIPIDRAMELVANEAYQARTGK